MSCVSHNVVWIPYGHLSTRDTVGDTNAVPHCCSPFPFVSSVCTELFAFFEACLKGGLSILLFHESYGKPWRRTGTGKWIFSSLPPLAEKNIVYTHRHANADGGYCDHHSNETAPHPCGALDNSATTLYDKRIHKVRDGMKNEYPEYGEKTVSCVIERSVLFLEKRAREI